MKSIYADYNASTPSTPEHNRKVVSILNQTLANPSSIHHLGRKAKLALEESRHHVAALFGSDKNKIIFTSGATEANNLVIQGFVYEHFFKTKTKTEIVITEGEHSSVRQIVEVLEKRGLCNVTYIPLNTMGFVDHSSVSQYISKSTQLVCLIHVNNETGAINPLSKLCSTIRKHAPHTHIHIDAVQSFGKMDLTYFASSTIDSASASGHKIGAFKGVGCLYVKNPVNLSPLIYGGGQERGWRAGTENLPGIISFGIRAEELIGKNTLPALEQLRSYLVDGLLKIPEVHLHGDPAHCLPTTVNFHVDGLRGEELLLTFDSAGIALSNGSACSSGGGRPSGVLKAMGYSEEIATHSVRVSFGEASMQEDIDAILKTLANLVRAKKRAKTQ